MIYTTRKEHFSSSNRLFNKNLSDKDNELIFGKCSNIHGHNYYLEITVCGETDPTTGYVIDLKLLKQIIDKEILEKVDHQHLNDLEMFKDVIPTTENIAKVFWNILKDKVCSWNYRLYSIKIYETEKNFIEYRG
ncbi:MAG: 6-carboxytetrahydropterin synthase [Ignavibacteria bacterium]|nr:6-carboxytetrahydropterin synthase [Ignavibacteria bacterium]